MSAAYILRKFFPQRHAELRAQRRRLPDNLAEEVL